MREEIRKILNKAFEVNNWNKELIEESIDHILEYYLEDYIPVTKAVRQWISDTKLNFEEEYKNKED